MNSEDIKRVCCYGVGIIGSSWALSFAWRGLDVNLYDIQPEALEGALNRIRRYLNGFKRNGIADDEMIEETLSRIRLTYTPEEALTDVQYVQESVMENYQTKHPVVDIIEQYAPADAIVGTSTSKLLITEICKNAVHPERYIGAHPYNPPHLLPLVELSAGEKTDPQVLRVSYDFFKSIKKEPVILNKETPGFVCNRVQHAVWRELRDLIGRGVISLEDANRCIVFGPGMRWGILGPTQCQIMSSDKGLMGTRANIDSSGFNMVAEIAAWPEPPAEIEAEVERQMEQYMLKVPGGFSTLEEAGDWRDDGLIALLKLHKKL